MLIIDHFLFVSTNLLADIQILLTMMSLPIISLIIYNGAQVSYLMKSKMTWIYFHPCFKRERIPNDFSPRHYYIQIKFYRVKYLLVFIPVFANFNKFSLPSEYEVMKLKTA